MKGVRGAADEKSTDQESKVQLAILADEPQKLKALRQFRGFRLECGKVWNPNKTKV